MERLTKPVIVPETGEIFAYMLKSGVTETKARTKLGKLEDLEEQGLLLRLPVSIGSDVFFIPSKANFGLNVLHNHEELNRVYHQKIARLHFAENGWYAEGNLNLEYGVVDGLFVDKMYKETWFTTKAEADAALEKMKGENHETD